MHIQFGPFTLHPTQRVLLEEGRPLRLGSRAFDLLVVLVERAGEVVPNAELLAAAWPNRVVEEGSLRMHIAALRKALGEGQGGRRFIANVPMRGYSFVAAVQRTRPAQPARDGAAASAGTPTPVRRLPQPLQRVIGRAEVIAELRRLLPAQRCVTLVGAGGVGKTTVALALADALSEHADDAWEVVFVELAALDDPQRVPAAVASALGLVLPAAEPFAAMSSFLRQRERLLLVMDNCEHVVAVAAALVEHLLQSVPGVGVLATSREALRIQGEKVLRLPSLALTAEGGAGAGAWHAPALQLFVERAASSAEGFVLREPDVPLALELCRRLDGIPLAIELAAAAVAQFGLRGLLDQLGAHLSMLSRGRRTALPRHHTLRATLDWSHALLSAQEQALLPRLAVFRSAFTRGDAWALADAPLDVDDALAGLVGKSMLVAQIDEEPVRYRLLETTRAYAAEKLAQKAELATAMAARHASWVLRMFHGAEGLGDRPPDAAWLAVHARHVDDLRAAAAWAFAADGDLSIGITLMARSAPLWFAQSLMDEYRRLAEQALAAIEQRPSTDPEDTMRLCEAYGHALWHTRGGGPAMAASFRRALQIAEELDATPYKLRCMWGLWLICNTTGDYAGSAAYAERFGVEVAGLADEATQLTHDRMMALGLHLHGQQRRARAYAERVLEHPLTINHTARHSGFQFDQRVAALTVMARITWVQGAPARAVALAREAVDEALAIDHSLSLCYAIANGAAPVAFWAGEIEFARRCTQLLRQRADERSLHFWQAFAGAYELLLALHDQGEAAPSRQALHQPGVALLLRETLATVRPCLFDDTLRDRALAGASGWCLPEMLRLQARRRLDAGGPADESKALLQRACELADEQGAGAWALRAATSLAQLELAAGRPAPAAAVLGPVLARFDADAPGPDVHAARQLFSAVTAVCSGSGSVDKD